MSGEAREAGRLTAFLSYSRDDLDFADQLEAALQAHKYDVAIDRHGISGGEDWKARLRGLIRDADTVRGSTRPARRPRTAAMLGLVSGGRVISGFVHGTGIEQVSTNANPA